MEKLIGNNKAELTGMFISNFRYSHEIFGEVFYTGEFLVERISENVDIIPVTISERLINISDEWIGKIVKIYGNIRSYNKHINWKNKLIISVFAREIEYSDNHNENEIFLNGYICKAPVYRKTPLGREIADIMLAVHRPYGKSDYIPCIAWGRNARYATRFDVGSCIQIWGRIQSREYNKRLSEEEYEKRTAYEISVHKMEDGNREENEDRRCFTENGNAGIIKRIPIHRRRNNDFRQQSRKKNNERPVSTNIEIIL